MPKRKSKRNTRAAREADRLRKQQARLKTKPKRKPTTGKNKVNTSRRTKAVKKADTLRKQNSTLEIVEAFKFSPANNVWKNQQLSRLNLPVRLPISIQNEVRSVPLLAPVAVHPISGDGNCLFRALSYALTEKEDYHLQIRAAICNYMRSNQDEIRYILPNYCNGDVEFYLQSSCMEHSSTWGTEVEILVAAVLLRSNIYVYSKSGVHWKWIKHSLPNVQVGNNIYLYHRNGNHFEVVLGIENSHLPATVSADQYYSPIEYERQRYRESKKNSARKAMKKLYQTNPTLRTKLLQSQKNRYSTDMSFADRKKNATKNRYHSNSTYKRRLKQASIMKYCTNSVFRRSLCMLSKNKYSVNVAFRQKVKKISKQRYATDKGFQQMAKDRAKQKYATDKEFQQSVKDKFKQKYATDKEFQQIVKDKSKQKYADKEFQQSVKDKLKQQYATDIEFQQMAKDKSKQKYATDKEFQQSMKVKSKLKYGSDLVFRNKVKDCSRKKYASNTVFRFHVKAKSRLRYQRFSSFRNNLKTSSIKKYAGNPLFRLKLKSFLKHKYHNDLEVKQRKKDKVKASRKKIQTSIRTFKRSIKDTPKYVCRICIRLLYRKQVKIFKEKRYFDKGTEKLNEMAEKCCNATFLHQCDETCQQNCWMALLKNNANWICHTCDTHLKKGNMPPQAMANNMYLPVIPPELSKLNDLERQLVSLRIPFMKLLSLPRGGQKGVKGPVVNVPSDIKTVTTALPRDINQAQLVKVKLKRKISYKGHYTFKWINPINVVDAIKYLKTHNNWYQNVQINDNWKEDNNDIDLVYEGNRSDEDDEVLVEDMEEHLNSSDDNSEEECDQNSDNLEEKEDSTEGLPVESCLEPIDIGQDVLDSNNTLCIAPAEQQTPQNIFTEEGSDAMAFPTLLPDGHFGLFEKREVKLSSSKYFNARLFSADHRFSSNNEFIFFAQYVTEISRISSNISLALRQGKTCTQDGQPVTATMLMNTEHVQNILKSDVGFRFLQPVRGTPPYLQRTMKDLYAMIRQLGIPTWFVTFSAAELRWPEVMETLLLLNNDGRQTHELEWSEKCSLVTDNPLTCARMFDHRVKSLFTDLIMAPSCPLGKVVDYFYRTEFQQRGSPHIHSLLWIENAPKLDENSDQEVSEFVDKYITCRMPIEEDDPELFDIISNVQLHSKSHSKSCRKYSTTCRFNFPRPPIRKTFVARPELENPENDVKPPDPTNVAEFDEMCKKASRNSKETLKEIWMLLSSAEDTNLTFSEILKLVNVSYGDYKKCLSDTASRNTIHIKRRMEDMWVNNYNIHLSKAWNANLDIQYVTDAYACVAYILSYISKAETEMGDLLQNAQKEASEGNVEAAAALKKIGSVYIQNREVSAQEAVYRVSGLHLKQCTRDVIFVPAGSNIFRMSLPISVIKSRSKEDDNENIWMTSIHEKYYARPNHPDFDNMCLAEFASKFAIMPKSQKPKASSKLPVFELQKDLGFIRQRKEGKEAVVRYPRFKPDKNSEDYYLSLVQLFLPHFAAITVPLDFVSLEDFVKNGLLDVERVSDIIEGNRKCYERNSDELEQARQEIEEGKIHEDAWGAIAPEAEVERLEIRMEKEDVDMDESEDIPELRFDEKSRGQTTGFKYEPPKISHKDLQDSLRSLNRIQQDVFYNIRDWSFRVSRNENPDPFFLFLTGGAGTGKSHVIRCLYHEVTRILSKGVDSADSAVVLLLAPTGTAAFNIQGMTIHSALAISKDVSLPYKPLGENLLNTLRSKFDSLKILIIDEISMVDQKILTYVHGRLSQIKHSKQPFGNVSILAVGDFYQLPPVKGLPLYKKRANDFLDLWNEHFSVVTLNEIMRQKDDCAFANMLNRLRVHVRGQPFQEDDEERLIQVSTNEVPANVKTCLHIFPTNKEVNNHNSVMIESVCDASYTAEAVDFHTDIVTGRTAQKEHPYASCAAEDLQTELKLGVGARVMLTRNIDTEDGLVNGAFGAVIGLNLNGSKVTSVYVRFDNNRVGKKAMKTHTVSNSSLKVAVLIKPVIDSLCGKKARRKQLPLKLAWAATIHKVQGMTVDRIVVSLKKIFQPGMAYVALSRATSLAGLHIVDFDPNSIYCSDQITEALKTMPLFLQQDNQTGTPLDVFKILLHNTEGLLPHLQDVKTVREINCANVVCLTETWLSQQHAIPPAVFPDFTIYSTTRSQAYDIENPSFSRIGNSERGGVAIFVKKEHLQRGYMFQTQNLEVVASLVLNALVVVIYRPPIYTIPLFIGNLTSLLQEIQNTNLPCIVVGDFNIDVQKERENRLVQTFNVFGFRQIVNFPTTEGGTCIDLAFVRGFDNSCSTSLVPTYYSYHDAVQICVGQELNG